MKKITLIAAFLMAVISYGQTISGFVTNPSFEDGSVGTIAQYQTLNDWKLGGANTTGASASIQSYDVHTGDGSNALEVTSEFAGTGGEWNVRLMNTTYPFDGDGINPIEVTVSFWAKTTDTDPASLNSGGDMRVLIKDTGSSNLGDQTNRVLLETDTWVNITKTFTFDAASDYNLSLYLEFGRVDGTTQIDGITASVTGGATLDASPEPDVVTYNGFVPNPSFEDGSAAAMVRNVTLDNWKLQGANAAGDNSASIQTTNVHDGDGSNALEVTNLTSAGEWNNKVTSTTYPFDGNNIDPIEVTVSFWAKTTDIDPVSGGFAGGDLKLIVRDAVDNVYRSDRAILTTNTWVNITKTFTFDAAPNYSLSLSLQFGRLEGVTQIDGITSSVTGGASLGLEDNPLTPEITASATEICAGESVDLSVEIDGVSSTDNFAILNGPIDLSSSIFSQNPNFSIATSVKVIDLSTPYINIFRQIEGGEIVLSFQPSTDQNTSRYVFQVKASNGNCFTTPGWVYLYANVSDNEFHKIVATYSRDQGEIKLFMDGVLADSGSVNNGLLADCDLYLPSILGIPSIPDYNNDFVECDEIGFYDYILDSSQIQSYIGCSQLQEFSSDYISYFNFNESDGNNAIDLGINNITASHNSIYTNGNCTNLSTYTWSTGETTESISVSPTETTEYWVDVTTNGVTSRDTITITVNTTDAPTGDAVQSFDTAATVADLSAIGDNLQWYDAATDGNLLESSAALTDAQVVYASQTVNGCESTERLEVTVVISNGQSLEDFTNSNATSSYSDSAFEGNNGITWSYIASRNGNNDANASGIELPALMLRRVASGSKITSSAIPGGISNFSVNLYKGFTGTGDRQVELFINGVSKGTSTPFDDFSEYTFSVDNINISGDIVIEIVNTTPKQIIIDNISWTGFSTSCSVIFGQAQYSCEGNSIGDSNDFVTVSVPYTGLDAGITALTTTSGGSIGGDNPATTPDGTIVISGVSEGSGWDLVLNGGDCDGISTSGTTDVDFCDPIPNTCYDLSNGDESFELVAVATNSDSDVWVNNSGTYTMNGYCGGGCTETSNTWLVFGPLDTTQTNDLTLAFNAAEQYGVTDLVVAYTEQYGGCPDLSQWITAATVSDPGTVEADLSQINGTDVYIGIQYYDNGTDGFSGWTLTDVTLNSFGNCPTLGTATPFDCACDVSLDTAVYTCNSNDGVIITIPYTGSEPSLSSITTSSTGNLGGDDPAQTVDGNIILSGLNEGDSWDIILNGGDCDGTTISGTVNPTGTCPPSTYEWINYGTQDWTVENAEMVTYRDGTPIPQVTDSTEWANLTTGAWCYYGNAPTNPILYNWYAVAGIHDNDPNTPNKELAPEGWHVPSDEEWTTLENHLIANGYNYDGTTTGNKIAKAMASTTGWTSATLWWHTGAIGNDQSLNNSSGFNALPEGYRYYYGEFQNGGGGHYAMFWSSTEDNTNNALHRSLYSEYNYLSRGLLISGIHLKQNGFSVRFVRDATSLSTTDFSNSIIIYPNPVKNMLTIDGLVVKHVVIYSVLGKAVLKMSNQNTIDVSSLSKGVYFIKVSDGINASTMKFIKD